MVTSVQLRDPEYRRVLRDLIRVVEPMLAPGVTPDDPRAVRFLAEARRHLGFYSDRDVEAHELASRCRWLLAQTASLEIAGAALDFIAGFAVVPDLGYPIDDARWSAKGECVKIVRAAARVHQDEIEHMLLTWANRHDFQATSARPDVFCLMADVGTRRSFDFMLAFLERREAEDYLAWPCGPPLLGQILHWLERHDFAPDLVRALNETVARQRWRAHFMAAYHRQLTDCARTFALLKRGRLFDRLAPGGVQLWDYWMTYAPEAAAPGG